MQNKKLSVVTLFFMLALARPSKAVIWTVDESHSSAQFSIKHMMVSNVRGEVNGVKGLFDIDDVDFRKSRFDATLELKSLNTNNRKRDRHLLGPDFFDVKRYPQIRFVSKQIIQKDGGKWNIIGALTMHGVTRKVVLYSDLPTRAMKDPYGSVVRGLHATAKLSRRDFGLNWNQPLEMGGVLLGDEVEVTLDLELEQPEAPKA